MAGIKSPSAYAPREAPDRALARRNRVLRAMRDTGTLKAEEARDLANTPLTVQRRDHDELTGEDDTSSENAFCGLYFKEEIRRLLLKRFGAKQLYQGGLRSTRRSIRICSAPPRMPSTTASRSSRRRKRFSGAITKAHSKPASSRSIR